MAKKCFSHLEKESQKNHLPLFCIFCAE
ncbi:MULTISPECIES: DUF4077 domain-containing protein [Bacillus]